jgi:hypothetical protein
MIGYLTYFELSLKTKSEKKHFFLNDFIVKQNSINRN